MVVLEVAAKVAAVAAAVTSWQRQGGKKRNTRVIANCPPPKFWPLDNLLSVQKNVCSEMQNLQM